MKCKLCNEYFFAETNFKNIFDFPKICSKCKIKFKPILEYEIIPYSYGNLYYYYLYSDKIINVVQKEYLKKYLYKIYNEMIEVDSKKTIIVFLDEDLLNDFEINIVFLKTYSKICMFSLIRINFDNFMSFF